MLFSVFVIVKRWSFLRKHIVYELLTVWREKYNFWLYEEGYSTPTKTYLKDHQPKSGGEMMMMTMMCL